MELNKPDIQKLLQTKTIGRDLQVFPEVRSTNDTAFSLALEGGPEGTVVLADSQTGGRGRLNRSWQSPAGQNLYLSVILRPRISPGLSPRISLVAAVAVADALSAFCPGFVSIKWPNDVLLGGRKACGILSELTLGDNSVDFIILGIGINVNMKKEDFDPEHRERSTSIFEETGRIISRREAAVTVLQRLDYWYGVYLAGGFQEIKGQWLSWCAMIGRRCRIGINGEIIEGLAVGIGDNGALIIELGSGEKVTVLTGDATVL